MFVIYFYENGIFNFLKLILDSLSMEFKIWLYFLSLLSFRLVLKTTFVLVFWVVILKVLKIASMNSQDMKWDTM